MSSSPKQLAKVADYYEAECRSEISELFLFLKSGLLSQEEMRKFRERIEELIRIAEARASLAKTK